MELNIDPNFSVYRLVGRVAHTATLNHRRTMNVISNEIENTTLVDGAKTRIFAAFQLFSRFVPQMKRYREIAERAEAVYVFGIPDVILPDIENVTYIPLKPTDQLAREWFLVSYGPEYASALATEEQTNISYADPDRLFKGIWTFDPTLVNILADWLSRSINIEPQDLSATDVDVERHTQLINRIAGRMMGRMTSDKALTMSVMMRQELRGIVRNTLQPYVAHSLEHQLAGV